MKPYPRIRVDQKGEQVAQWGRVQAQASN